VVVGYSGFEENTAPFAIVYDGTTWNKASFSLPSGVTQVALRSVSCVSSTFCAAAGYGYNSSSVISSVVSVYDGQSWSSTALDPDPSGNGEMLTSISCASSTWCVAVDHSSDAQYTPHPLAVSYDGQSWTKVDLSSLTASASGALQSVSCPTSTSCSAFGSYKDSNAKPHFFVATYDGQSWTESDLPELQPARMALPLSISCSSPKFCVAAGWMFTASYKMVSVAWVFDGQTWTAVDVSALSAFPQLDGLSCTATSCTGIGKYIDAQYQGHLMTVTVTVPTSGPQLSIVAGNGHRGAPTPGPATASSLWGGQGLATDDAGNLYIADDNAHVIEKVDPSGNLTIVAGTGNLGRPTEGSALSSDFSNLCGIAIDHSGNIFVSDAGNKVVEKIDAQGVLSIYAGIVGTEGSPTPGPAISSSLRNPQGLAVDASGNLYIADNDSYVVEKVDTNGTLSIVAGTGNYGYPAPGPATSSALTPIGVTIDPSGNLYIADQLNNVVEKVDTSGTLSIFAGKKDPDREV
jgi:hypothetical protein